MTGFFFSIIFDAPAKSILKRDDVDVVEVRVLADPLTETRSVPPAPKTVAPQFSGWLDDWSQRFNIRDVSQPLGRDDRRQRLVEIRARLPEEYLEVTEQADGFLVNDCSVLGLAEVYEIVMVECSYYLLAELDGRGVLAVESGASDGIVYYLDYEGGEGIRVESFRKAIETYIESGRVR